MTEDTHTTQLPEVKLSLHWHLASLLVKHKVKRVHLEKDSGVSVNTIIDICRRTDLDRFNVSNAQTILNSLRRLTGEDLQLSDLLTVSTSIGGQIVSVLGDIEPPEPKAPLFEEPKESEAQKLAREEKARQEAKAKAAGLLLAEAKSQGLTVFVFKCPSNRPQGGLMGVATRNKNQAAKVAGVGKSVIYNDSLQENPEEPEVLKALLSKPDTLFLMPEGATEFAEASTLA